MCSCHQIRRYHQVSKRLSSDRPSWSKLCTVMHGQQGYLWVSSGYPVHLEPWDLASLLPSLLHWWIVSCPDLQPYFFMCHKNHPWIVARIYRTTTYTSLLLPISSQVMELWMRRTTYTSWRFAQDRTGSRTVLWTWGWKPMLWMIPACTILNAW